MKVLLKNKKATYEYSVLEKFVAGISLKGWETKSIMQLDCSIGESFVSLKDGSAFVNQMHISDKNTIPSIFTKKNDEYRERRLLLTKPELKKLEKMTRESGMTIIPVSLLYSDSKKIKIEIAVCKGKKLYDKRNDLKKKQQELDIKRSHRL